MNSDDNKDDPKSLQNTFGAKTADRVEQNYAADSDLVKTLLGSLRDLLNPSATARRLMDMADRQGISVKFLKGREEAAYVPENKWVFLSITTKTKANSTLALRYAGALREAEQNILGFERPGEDITNDSEWLEKNLAKNLDIIINLCTIVKEISEGNQHVPDFLDSLTTLGHDDIYKAFVNQASEEEMMRILAIREGLNIKNEG